MLDTLIHDKLDDLLDGYVGVHSRDTLPPITNFPASLIANIDTSDMSGSHWVGIYFDKFGRADYFDSYGLPPLYSEFLEYLQKYSKLGFEYNKVALQCKECVTCGEYASAFVILRTFGWSFAEFIKLFSTNTYTNDYIIKSLHNALSTSHGIEKLAKDLRTKFQDSKRR